MKHLLILTSDTGFGHRSAANSVVNAMSELHPFEVNTTIVNPVFDQPSPGILRKTQRDYDRNVVKNPGFYRFTYEISNSRPVASLVEGTMVMALYKGLKQIYADVKPDVILNTFTLFNAPMGMVLDACHKTTPLYTVVTDLADVHSIWFNNRPDGFFVANESVKAKAEDCGIPPENIIVSGIPVDHSLDPTRHNKAGERTALGLNPSLPTILFVGSPRVTGINHYLQSLEKASFPFQVVVIAGGNQNLFNELVQRSWNFPIHVENFIKNMPNWLGCADLLVTKAGGLILSEGLAAGLPIILIDHLPGQEDGNVRYILENKAGVCLENSDQLLSIVQYWLANDAAVLHQISMNALKAGFPHSSIEIAEVLWQAALFNSPVKEQVNLC